MKSDGFLSDIQLKREILKHIENETVRLTKHAAEEQKNDEIDLQDTLHVLKTGIHEKQKTRFDNKFQSWKYAIKGKTEGLEIVRVIIAFTDEMMIVTVIKLKPRL